jgi:4-coumarate--CoA ligase
MTEMSPASHINPPNKIVPGSVGVLIPNCVAKIVDTATGELLGVGKDGELCIKGPNVMKCYLNNEAGE